MWNWKFEITKFLIELGPLLAVWLFGTGRVSVF